MNTKTDLDAVMAKIVSFSKVLFEGQFKYVILYGSYARGDNDCESDVDVMIVVDMPSAQLSGYRRSVSDYCAGLDLDNGIFLAPKLQSVEVFEAWKDVLPYYINVEREGIRYA